jgi:hypothetical protein
MFLQFVLKCLEDLLAAGRNAAGTQTDCNCFHTALSKLFFATEITVQRISNDAEGIIRKDTEKEKQ